MVSFHPSASDGVCLTWLKCGLFPVSFSQAPGMALYENTERGSRSRAVTFLQCRSYKFFQDLTETTLQKQMDCGFVLLHGFVGLMPRRIAADGSAGPKRATGTRVPDVGRNVNGGGQLVFC